MELLSITFTTYMMYIFNFSSHTFAVMGSEIAISQKKPTRSKVTR